MAIADQRTALHFEWVVTDETPADSSPQISPEQRAAIVIEVTSRTKEQFTDILKNGNAARLTLPDEFDVSKELDTPIRVQQLYQQFLNGREANVRLYTEFREAYKVDLCQLLMQDYIHPFGHNFRELAEIFYPDVVLLHSPRIAQIAISQAVQEIYHYLLVRDDSHVTPEIADQVVAGHYAYRRQCQRLRTAGVIKGSDPHAYGRIAREREGSWEMNDSLRLAQMLQINSGFFHTGGRANGKPNWDAITAQFPGKDKSSVQQHYKWMMRVFDTTELEALFDEDDQSLQGHGHTQQLIVSLAGLDLEAKLYRAGRFDWRNVLPLMQQIIDSSPQFHWNGQSPLYLHGSPRWRPLIIELANRGLIPISPSDEDAIEMWIGRGQRAYSDNLERKTKVKEA